MYSMLSNCRAWFVSDNVCYVTAMVVLVEILPGHEVRLPMIGPLLDHHMVNESTGRLEYFNLFLET